MRIKVTGYIDSKELPEEFVDEKHPSGLSEEGDLAFRIELPTLTDLDFKADK